MSITPQNSVDRSVARPPVPATGVIPMVLDMTGTMLALPFLVQYGLEAVVFGRSAAFESASQLISLVPGKLGGLVRRGFYRRLLHRCSRSCAISFGVLFSDRRAEIDERVYIGPNCDLGWVAIEEDVLLGSGVHVLSGKNQHGIADPETPIRLQKGVFEQVRIGRGSWIGNGAILMANVGRYCVVGAGSVVSRDVDDYSIVAGNPARLIRKRGPDGDAARSD